MHPSTPSSRGGIASTRSGPPHTAPGPLRRATVALAVTCTALALALLGAGESAAHAAPEEHPAGGRWDEIMGDAIARTAPVPGAQAPSAWAVIEPATDATGGSADEPATLVTFSGGAGGAGADTPFLVGSLSKPLTATAIMRLVDAEEVELDAEVSEYLPGFRPQDSDPITIAQLLTHTSGFSSDAGLDARRDPTLSIEDRAAAANEIPRRTDDAAAFEYSNLNYAILGAVIEAVSGDPFAAHLDRELFAPLGMRDSSAEPGTAQEIAAAGHRLAFGVPVALEETVPTGAAPDGYTVSTAHDLAAFMRMLLRDGVADDGTRVLSADSVRVMLTEHAPATAIGAAAPDTTGYGLGWGIGGTAQRPVVAHVGRTDGFFAHAHLRPAGGQGVVIVQAANGPMYDQTAPVRAAVAAFDGRDPGDVASEPAVVTAAIFAAFGVLALGAVLLVGWLRTRRDRRSPAATPAAAVRRVTVRAVLDVAGAALVVSLWLLAAGLMLTGSPSWGSDPFAASIELTVISWIIGGLLLARGIMGIVRVREHRERLR